jgi:hypothetical protein
MSQKHTIISPSAVIHKDRPIGAPRHGHLVQLALLVVEAQEP